MQRVKRSVDEMGKMIVRVKDEQNVAGPDVK